VCGITCRQDEIVSGNASGVQSAATALEQDIQAAFGTTTPASTPQTGITQASTAQARTIQTSTTQASTIQAGTTRATSSSTSSCESQNSFLIDFQALMAAAGSNDTAGMQSAAKDLAQDIQSAVDGAASSQVSGHHHHHHHHHHSAGTANAASAGTTTAMANSFTSAPAQGNDGDDDDQGEQTTGQTSGTGMSSALKNAQEAYQLLMSFSQQTTNPVA
jgi:hypothetical protein